jgi:hypothetical protein
MLMQKVRSLIIVALINASDPPFSSAAITH